MADSFTAAARVRALPPYLFAEIDRKKKELVEKGIDIVDLGIGDPDLPTPPEVVEALRVAVGDPSTHRYAFNDGSPLFREAAAAWFEARFGVPIDPMKEVISLLGSKEGIGHLPLAFVNPGEKVLVPEPAYPVYRSGTVFAGGEPYYLPLTAANGFLPDLNAIPEKVLDEAVLWFVNYPCNPTSAIADLAFYEKVIALARRHRIIVASDAAYSEIYYRPEDRPPSILQVPGAKEVAIELHSLSKPYNMTGWRVGFAVGAPELLRPLAAVKANLDSGIFQAVQVAGAKALEMGDAITGPLREIYRKRRDLMIAALRRGGFHVDPPKGAFYLWVPLPAGVSSAVATARLLTEAGVVSTPGNGFGPSGEGYIRFSLTVPDAQLEEAARRLAALSWS
jgi:LL-diaminopimelate aminotransferase